MASYYNEVDKFAAAWLRELIKAGLIADGEVDERSITDVQPGDLRGFTQCHFFAGIGGWSYALRLAGWPDDRPVWTGSCPCQPFSSAGAQAGGHDPRDLWPVWFELVRQCRPVVCFGEQVEAAIGHGWLDRLCDDLEGEGYAVGASGLPSASVGAFDIRQRLWFVADATSAGWEWAGGESQQGRGTPAEPGRLRANGGMADTENAERRTRTPGDHWTPDGDDRCGCWDRDAFHRIRGMLPGEICVNKGRMADSGRERHEWERLLLQQRQSRPDSAEVAGSSAVGVMGNTIGDGLRSGGRTAQSIAHESSYWALCDWIDCADGKARPVEPGTFPLAHGIPASVGRLRGYGNAINPYVAAAFIEAYVEARGL